MQNYQLTRGWPQRLDTGESVNPNTNKEYLDWLAAGNIPKPYTLPTLTIKEQITQLETTITSRRIRESILGLDNGWLKDVNSQIAALRAQLI